MSIKHFQLCDRISYIALSLSVFLGMIAFVPGGFISSSALKGYLLVASVLVAFVAWLVARLIEGSFHIPRTPVIASAGILILVLFLSALFSKVPYLSFFGESFESGTFAVLGSLLLGVFLCSMIFAKRARIYAFFQTFFLVYIVLAVFQLVHIFIPNLTSLGMFYNRADTPLGVWSDFSLISGAALIGFVLVLQFMRPTKMARIISLVGAALALFFVILTNILMVWILVGISAVVILVYALIVNRFSENRPFPFLMFGLSLVTLFFILANGLVGPALSNLLNVSYIDVHPSLNASLQVSGASLRIDPVFGAGPNRFLSQWLEHRPTIVNNNRFWDSAFLSGSSFLMTTGVLSGALGILALLMFLLSYGYEGFSKAFRNGTHPEDGIFMFSLLLISFYFILAMLLYSPGISVIIPGFMLVGIFVAALVGEGRIGQIHIGFLKETRAGFFSILAIVLLLMVSAGTAYASTQRFAAGVFFQRGVKAAQNGDLDRANLRIGQAIELADLPLFERTRTAVAAQSIRNTMAASGSSSEQVRTVLQNAVAIGNAAVLQAIALDPTDPANYTTRGDFMGLLAPLKVEGSFAAAEEAYMKVIEIAPHYPKSYLSLAQLYFEGGDSVKARSYIEKALNEKTNYTEAYFLLARIEAAAGNTAGAIRQLQSATTVDPSNPDTYFELGRARYENGNYSDAAASFRTAISLNPQYFNAWYYLALADIKIGANAEAKSILTALNNKFPNNADVTAALNRIGAPVEEPKEDTPTDKKTSTPDKKKAVPVESTKKAQ